ncbi:acyl-CoA thioester hydrolase [Sphingomonas jejuensis]|uniref:Acyl-CoA thioester hydrolase n=1 Tax=Sphingomonas jejuensis TaxID=904715 RepID=A0ABX0XP43_9SPHN|nr:acyl-CoA thioester hydrolase [Sphingomonas jejuensis]
MSRQPLVGRSGYRHWTTIATRWADNDVYGHVNNVVHYGWFDTAVNGWLIGRELVDIHHGPVIGLVVESGCSYAAPLEYPGNVEVGLAAVRVGGSSVTYRLGIFAEGAESAAAEGRFTHVYVDRVTRRPVPLPDRWREELAAIGPD